MSTHDGRAMHRESIRTRFGIALTVTAMWLCGGSPPPVAAGPLVAQSASTKARPRKKARVREANDPQQVLKEVETESTHLRELFQKIRDDYGDPDRLYPKEGIKKQYEEATYLYLVGDYEKAALLFYAVLQKADRVDFPEYERAEFLLAESLELGGNLASALSYYDHIVGYGAAHKYYQRAIVKTIELHAKVGDFEKFEALYNEYMGNREGLEPGPEILYALGKTLYRKGAYQRALKTFQKLLDQPGDYPHLAGYYVGAIYVVQNELEAATKAFMDVLRQPVTTNEQREVEDLAYLALGRIYAEMGQYDKALDYYKNILRDSPHYVDALYEQAWVYIQDESYDQAIRTIDILLLTFPDNVNVPNLKLMRGLLQKRRRQYDDALDTYQKLVAEYTSVKEELDRIMAERGDILSYFSDLIENDLGKVEATYLAPELALRFATADRDMAHVIQVAKEVRAQQRELHESVVLLRELEERVQKRPARNVLVGMRTARSLLGGIQDRILLTKERIILAEQYYLQHLPDEQARAEAALWVAKNGDEGALAEQIPERQRDANEILEVYEDQVQEVRRIAYKLENLIEDLLAQAAAIEKYVEYSRENGTLSPDVEREARFQVSAEREQLETYARSLDAVQRDLAAFDVRAFVQPSQIAAEQAFREEAEKHLDRIHRGLLGLSSRLRIENEALAGLDAQYEALDKLSGEVQAFYDQLDGIEAHQVAEVQARLSRERRALEACGEEARDYEEETRQLAEVVARNSFRQVHKQFSDLVLNADFGITDVYWELKEEKSNEIDENLERRGKEIQALRKRFAGLQEGDL